MNLKRTTTPCDFFRSDYGWLQCIVRTASRTTHRWALFSRLAMASVREEEDEEEKEKVRHISILSRPRFSLNIDKGKKRKKTSSPCSFAARRSVLYTLVEARPTVYSSRFLFAHRHRLDVDRLAIINSPSQSFICLWRHICWSTCFLLFAMLIGLFQSSRFSSCLTNELTTVSTMTTAEGSRCHQDLNVHEISIVNDQVSSSSARRSSLEQALTRRWTTKSRSRWRWESGIQRWGYSTIESFRWQQLPRQWYEQQL